MVGGLHVPDGAGASGRFCNDVALVVGAVVMREQEMEDAGGFVEDEAGVAAGIVAVMTDDFRRAPRKAAVGGAFEDEFDSASVVETVFASLGEGEEVAIGGADDGRDAVSGAAVSAGDEDIGLDGSSGR